MTKFKKRIKDVDIEKKITETSAEIYDMESKEITKQTTAEKIYKTLKEIIDEKNKKAHKYQMEFNNRLFKRLDKKGRNTLLKKYFGTEDRKEALKMMFDPKYEDIYKKYKEEEKQIEKKETDKIFEIFKRSYNKKIGLHKGNDIDKKAIVFLLKKSGFFTNKETRKRDIKGKIKEISHGESLEKGLTLDSGKTSKGIKIENVEKNIQGKIHKTLIGSKAIIDEHPDDSEEAMKTNRPTSSTHILHTILRSLNKIPPKEKAQMQRFVDFVDMVDGLEYQASNIDYKNSNRTLFGLHHNIPIEDIYTYFANPTHTGFEILSNKELEKHNIKKIYKKDGKKIIETKTRKDLSDSEKEKMEKDIKQHEQTKDRGLKLNNTRFVAVFDNEFYNAPQIMAYNHEGTFKIGIDKETQKPYLYIFNPFQEFKKPIGGIKPNGHFIHKKNINKEILGKVLHEFNNTRDYIFTKKAKNQAKRDIMKYFDSIAKKEKPEEKEKKENTLPQIDVNKIKIGQIVEGIIRNVRKDKIFVKLGEKVSGVIEIEKGKEEKKEEIKSGERVKVKIINIEKTEDNKTHIYLKKIA